jgi:hypothetical protein
LQGILQHSARADHFTGRSKKSGEDTEALGHPEATALLIMDEIGYLPVTGNGSNLNILDRLGDASYLVVIEGAVTGEALPSRRREV